MTDRQCLEVLLGKLSMGMGTIPGPTYNEHVYKHLIAQQRKQFHIHTADISDREIVTVLSMAGDLVGKSLVEHIYLQNIELGNKLIQIYTDIKYLYAISKRRETTIKYKKINYKNIFSGL